MGFSLLLRCQTAPGWGDGTVPPSTLLVPGWKATPGVLAYLPSCLPGKAMEEQWRLASPGV